MTKDRGFDFSKIINSIPDINDPQNKGKSPVLDACKKIDEKRDKFNAELEKYRQESLVDSLTGCYNRNYFEKFKNDNFNPNRDHNYLGLVFIDLNGLKKVNDTQGHEAGDNLIKDTASFLKTNFRREDVVIRLGGDEFVVICRNQQNDNNFEINLTSQVRERRDLKSKDLNTPISFAFGVAVYDQVRDSKDINETQKLADQRMYQNKAEIKAKLIL